MIDHIFFFCFSSNMAHSVKSNNLDMEIDDREKMKFSGEEEK